MKTIFYMFSGINAGTDMAFQIVADIHSHKEAQGIARRMEYFWNEDASNDPFSL
ncbi:hypothetical protein [Citrobacter koseri]|uniref:hypothetical protein n=1 Tax=Citrobacter koseri TaxID=545 RepID=UPI0028BDC3D1|nr:hypothetical protein [Citrobacter koseri]MDT7462131.1 hypothetical protein [Citrobacter koseri]